MKFIKVGLIICAIALSIWTYMTRQESSRKPAMVFAQQDVKLEFRPLLAKPALKSEIARQNSSDSFHAQTRRPKMSQEEAYRLRREELLARDKLSTVELALEMEIARLNELRAQSLEANALVADIMLYFEGLRGDKNLTKRYKNVPTDELGQALDNKQFGETVIHNKKVLAKWKRLMAISAENDEIATTSVEN